MELNEIKKALYKEKPTAFWLNEYNTSDGEVRMYEADTSLGYHMFAVPIDEMGETKFEKEVPAQLLIRWLVK